MKSKDNPFQVEGYWGKELFCDREEESKTILENAKNGVNTTLLSIRRMGKTGLIHHVFEQLKETKDWAGIYVDIYATRDLVSFSNQLATAIFQTFPQNKSIGKQFLDLLKRFNPTISYDPLSGAPEVSLGFADPEQYEYSLKGLFQFLDQQPQRILLAIDEFQQIANYPENNMEAILRTIIQNLRNVNLIYSGSHRHLLAEMFSNSKRPFFASTQSIYLQEIPYDKYADFIQRVFEKHRKNIGEEEVDFILNWTKRHTYYSQSLCNKVFALYKGKIKLSEVHQAADLILQREEMVFYQYRRLLTDSQWNLLRAIAREDKLAKPTSGKFISKYDLGNSASVLRSLDALEKKEMIYREWKKEKGHYQVQDCFLSRWLARLPT